MPITFNFRNYSTTHDVKFTLRLSTPELASTTSDFLPPTYSGRMMRKNVLAPGESSTVSVKLQARQPGAYSINDWQTETEVLEVDERREDDSSLQVPVDSKKQRVRRKYISGASRANTVIVTEQQRI